MRKLAGKNRERVIGLRIQGRSIPEISRETGVAKTTVQRHVKGIEIPKEFRQRLKEKQGGAKDRANGLRENIAIEIGSILGRISDRDLLFLLVGLYWGEGTKRDFSLINSDPVLVRTFIRCLKTLHISEERLSLSLRLHTEISIPRAKTFWARVTGLSRDIIERVEVIEGRKKGKLPHGMCRVRVKTGIRERLLIQTAISLIGKECSNTLISP